MQLTGAEIICECLLEQGVDTVFGYPGGAALNTYDALYKYSDKIRHILTAHEQGASHAADGYARATGKTGVVMTTSGPGATNIVTGLATANIDSIPLVAITGNVTTDQLGRDSFQEVDIVNIVKPVTKASFLVEKVEDLADTIRKAFALAQHGRKGPVLVDVPKDVTANKTEFVQTIPERPRTFEIRNPEKVRVVQEMIKNAKRPMIYAGGGIISADASEEFKAFAELIDAPVCCSLMGLGCIPADHPLCVGNIGMHGGYETGMATAECDLMIACGARFSDRVTGNPNKFASNAKILQFDIDVAEMNKNVIIDEGVVGDIKEVLAAVNEKLPQQEHTEWIKKIQEYKAKYPLAYHPESLTGPYVIEEIYKQTEGDAIIVTEVGQHQMWAAQYYKFTKPRTLLTSGGLGTMGYGLGAAIGAKMGRPEKTVVNIAGDGCFRMNMNEVATAARYNIPIIQVVVNNHVLGMVRQWQNLFYGQRYSATVLNDAVDFVKLAEAMGAKAVRATTREEFADAFKFALNAGGPVVIDCQIDSDDKVWPMVAPGAPISEAFDEKDLQEKQQTN